MPRPAHLTPRGLPSQGGNVPRFHISFLFSRLKLLRAAMLGMVVAFGIGSLQHGRAATDQTWEADFTGHYMIVESLASGGGAPYNGTVDFNPRRSPLYSVNWKFNTGKKMRGLGLRDGADLMAVTLNTGGAAYGLAIYRREAEGKQWRGPWITSIDSGGTVGEIGFDAGDASTLPGRHTFIGRRGRMGAFSGTVNITPRGEGFLLNFTTSGGVALYRGIGVLCGDNRLAVAWSFGGTPSIAVYQPNEKKGLTGRRLSLPRSREDALAGTERLAREGVLDDTIFPPLLPTLGPGAIPPPPSAADDLPAADANGNSPNAITLLSPKNVAPDVKTLVYADLMRRHYRDGLAARWLREQLLPEERALLAEAVKPRPSRQAGKSATSGKTVAQLIEEQRGAKEKP